MATPTLPGQGMGGYPSAISTTYGTGKFPQNSEPYRLNRKKPDTHILKSPSSYEFDACGNTK